MNKAANLDRMQGMEFLPNLPRFAVIHFITFIILVCGYDAVMTTTFGDPNDNCSIQIFERHHFMVRKLSNFILVTVAAPFQGNSKIFVEPQNYHIKTKNEF